MSVPGCLSGLMLGGGSPYAVDAAYFDGANDYATRGAGLTGAADSKILTIAHWVNTDSAVTTKTIFTGSTAIGGGTSKVDARYSSDGAFTISATNAAGSKILSLSSSTNVSSGSWSCILISFDLSDTAKRHLYVGDTNALSAGTYTNDTMDLTLADWAIGASAGGSNKLAGGLAQLMVWFGTYVDFSVEATRRLFYSSTGKPVDPTNAISSIGAPIVYCHLDDGETANNFVANNDGGATGGAFTVTGGLTTASTSPSD